MIRIVLLCAVSVLGIGAYVPGTHAADISVQVSSDQAYVGFPITLQVQIENVSEMERPEIDDIDGLAIKSMGKPSQNLPVISINGRVTSTSSVTYQWSVTPKREGDFTIPPIQVHADGMTSITKAVRIKATKSDPGDRLIAEVQCDQKSVFVGEPIELTLKIFVKAFIDEEENIRLSDGSMWGLLSDQTQWGVFAETMDHLTMNRMQPRGFEVTRKDADGEVSKYYRYEIDATVYPGRPGPVDLEGVQIGFDYPLEISKPNRGRRGGSPFESMLGDDFPFPGGMFGDIFFGVSRSSRRITKSMPLLVEPVLDSITAKPIPTKDQPKDFAGAVGRYVIETSTSDTTVQAGDPIELTIRVRGTGQMETIAAPPLASIDELTVGFKVSSEPLAGQVDRDQKIFTTTIRPENESVTEIPAIPFSYFDPAIGGYETSYSQPIPITVTPAEILKLKRSVRAKNKAPVSNVAESETEAASNGPNVNLAWRKVVINRDQTKLSLVNVVAAALLFPPLIFTIGLLMRGYVAFNRHVASESKTLHRIKSADRSIEMAAAMKDYLGRRWKVSPLKSTEDDASMDRIIGRLRSEGLHRYAVRVEQWMDQVKSHGVQTDAELESIRESAMEIVKDAKSQRRVSLGRSVAALILFCVLASTSSATLAEGALSAEDLGLGDSQELIERAESAYRQGDFVGAAELLDSVGAQLDTNQSVFVNLGNARWQSGDGARAKASYLRTLDIDPTDDTARKNLLAVDHANWMLGKVGSLPMRPLLFAALAAWTLLWLNLALRLWWAAIPWRTIAAVCIMVLVLAGGMTAIQISTVWFPHHAVIVADEIELRSGDGDSFDIVRTIADASGRTVRWKAKRPGWIQVVTGDGSEGWVPVNSVEIVSG